MTTIRIHITIAPALKAAADRMVRATRRVRRRLRFTFSASFRSGIRAEQRHWIDPLDAGFVRQAVAPYLITDDTDDSTPAGGGL
jgi:hypothetical protein